MSPKYRITLTVREREKLESLIRKKTTPAKKILQARAILLSDAGPDGSAWKIADVAARLGISSRTIGHLKQRCIQEGIDAALKRRTSNKPSRNIVFDQQFEAGLLALAGSQPPSGHRRWTVRLLADKAVENNLTPRVSHMTVHRILKKFHINLSSSQMRRSHRGVAKSRTAATRQKLAKRNNSLAQPVFARSAYEAVINANRLNSEG